VNGSRWVQLPGHNGMCLHLDGNQYVSLGNILQDGYPELSIACWEKTEGTGYLGIIAMRSSWDQPDGIGLGLEPYADFGHWHLPGGTTIHSKALQPDRLHHLVGVLARNGSNYTYSLYVDGQLDGTTTADMGLIPTTGCWLVGAQSGGTYSFRGFLKDLRIYDCALSGEQVEAIYAEQPSLLVSSPPTPPPPFRPNLTDILMWAKQAL
jgi:hypothetical protein